MKSQWFGDRTRYEFAKLVQEADYHRHSYENFGTFLDMASLALRQAVNRANFTFDEKIEEQYAKCIKQVKHPANLAHAMGVLVEALEAKPYDFLGIVMSEWGMNDRKWAGQCFTPTDLCRVMAELTFDENITPISEKRLLISEPACGGGAMIIAAAQHLKSKGFFPWNYWVHAVDVDIRCVQMTYIQCTFLGIPAVVSHGNTISQEMRSHWPTLTAVLHPLRESQMPDESPEPPAEPAQDVPAGAARQLSLF